jgi:hypothetical protein
MGEVAEGRRGKAPQRISQISDLKLFDVVSAALPHPTLPRMTGEDMSQRSLSFGSIASRRASPNRLAPSTVNTIARPGKIAIQGAVVA